MGLKIYHSRECLASMGPWVSTSALVKEPGGRGGTESDNQPSKVILSYVANMRPVWATVDSVLKMGNK